MTQMPPVPRSSGQDRDRFGSEELAVVLSHFDIGVLESIKEYPRGSRKSPKLLVRSEKGEFLLKRRARGRDDPFKVAFCHAIQLFLAARQFPLPHLIGTRQENNSMLQWGGSVYELFEYIRGSGYDGSLDATQEAGKVLALYHKLLRDYKPQFDPPYGSYHNAKYIFESLDRIPVTLSQQERARNVSLAESQTTVNFLTEAYRQAALTVNQQGMERWPLQIVHADWHPGNMLYRGPRVVAVIDYDSARLQQRIIDLANGALQFAMLSGPEDPSLWPEHLDEERFVRFLRGYDEVEVISMAELQVVPWLMIEALVAESALPIAATGSFGRMEGYGFLQMIERKVRWVKANRERLVRLLG